MRYSSRRGLHLGVVCLGALVAGSLVQGGASGAADPKPDPVPHRANAESARCHVPSRHNPAVIKTVYRVGKRRHVSGKVMLSGFETGWVESHMNNLRCGDRDSLGVFQQRSHYGSAAKRLNVDWASNEFFKRAQKVERKHPTWSAGRIAQKVQVSAHPDRYNQAEPKARQLINEARGGKPTNPYSPERACGKGYKKVRDGVRNVGKLGKVYLLFNNKSGKNCVVTLKTAYIGKSTRTTAILKIKNRRSVTTKKDDAAYKYYAAVKASARGKCVAYTGYIYTPGGQRAKGERTKFKNCG